MIAKLRTIRFTPYLVWLSLLALGIIVGLSAGVIVLIKGLGVTNLSDTIPWGLWITIDLSSIALAAGAFSFCAAVYLLKLEDLEPMAKTAAWIGIIGYTMAMMCLFLDIGRPDRFYHGFIFWNTHSVLWEVTMCVGLYFSVLLMENIPTIAELDWLKNRYPELSKKMASLHRFAPYLAIAGLLLSMLHQSSLGATYGVVIAKPIWFRPGLAFLFFLSAVAGGISMTTAATIIVGYLKPEVRVKEELIQKVTRFLGWMLVAYLYMRFWDMFAMTYTPQPGRLEGLSLLTAGPLSFNLWFGEILVGALVPIILLLNGKLSKHKALRLLALLLVVGGVEAYRWDTNMVGKMIVQRPFESAPMYAQYFPSMIEFAAGAGIIAFGLLLFTLGVQYLRVVDHRPQLEHIH
jgi:molybdopterin-containing oxidoreductase family membrane subunit